MGVISTLAQRWNVFVHWVVHEWAINDWGNNPSDWTPVFYIAIVAAVLAVIVFFIFLALAAQGVVHTFCFWSAWTLIKMFAVYMIALFGYRFAWTKYLWPVHWIDTRLEYAGALGGAMLVGILIFFALGTMAWIIKQILNGLCPLPSEGHDKRD